MEVNNITTSLTKAVHKYNKKTYKRFNVNVRKDTQSNIIAYLEKQKSINSYIIALIENDMKISK